MQVENWDTLCLEMQDRLFPEGWLNTSTTIETFNKTRWETFPIALGIRYWTTICGRSWIQPVMKREVDGRSEAERCGWQRPQELRQWRELEKWDLRWKSIQCQEGELYLLFLLFYFSDNALGRICILGWEVGKM